MTDIIEKQLVGKRTDMRLCEDGLFASDDFIAVIDGVTSKGRQRWRTNAGDKTQGLSCGGYAKEIILSELENMPREIEKHDFFERLDCALSKAYFADVENDDITEWLRACIVVYSDFHKQVWSLGDCCCMINGKMFDSGKKIDSVLADLRAFVIEKALKDGNLPGQVFENDSGRQAILPFINMQLAFENDSSSRFGYGVLNGHGLKEDFIAVYDIMAGDTVVLASDGYPVLCDTLEKSELELENVLKNDPHCYKLYPETKGVENGNCSFDDRAYIKFSVR